MGRKNLELIKSDEQVALDQPSNLSLSLSLSNLINLQILKSPDNNKLLSMKGNAISGHLSDGINNYTIQDGSPVLYPKLVSDAWEKNHSLTLKNYNEPLLQYVLLSQLKQSGEINAPFDSVPARKHQWRYKEFCSDLKGLVLDIGSDRPSHSMQFLPKHCKYIGLDPYAGKGEFRLIGLGEILPIIDEAVHAVTFNTSLDHILDYHTAISEAHRVLKPSGKVIIASYAWVEKAALELKGCSVYG